ncbi:uncharacterized protein LOC144116392 [Amblyomma americanum]
MDEAEAEEASGTQRGLTETDAVARSSHSSEQVPENRENTVRAPPTVQHEHAPARETSEGENSLGDGLGAVARHDTGPMDASEDVCSGGAAKRTREDDGNLTGTSENAENEEPPAKTLSVFARATVCNLFIVAKIWYVLQVMCMKRVNVQKLHRVLAVFVWGSTWERTSRTNLFPSVREGGAGLSHLFLRQVVSRFMFLWDESDPFLRSVIQVRLRELLPNFVVSTSDVRSTCVRGFLFEVVAAFQTLKARFSLEFLCTVSKKQLYKDICDLLMPMPLYSSIYSAGPGEDVLKRVKKMPIRSSAKPFFFQLHSNTLTVKPCLQTKRIFVPWSTNCLLCRRPETTEHIFLVCWDAVFLWDCLQRTLKKDLPLSPRGIRFLPVQNLGSIPLDIVMLLGLHSLWKVRMAVWKVDINIRPARQYFIESILYVRDALKSKNDPPPPPPEWICIMKELASLKRF